MNLQTHALNPVSALLPMATSQHALLSTQLAVPNVTQPSFARLLQDTQAPTPVAAPAPAPAPAPTATSTPAPPRAPGDSSKQADKAARPNHPETPAQAHAHAQEPARPATTAQDKSNAAKPESQREVAHAPVHERSHGREAAAHDTPPGQSAKAAREAGEEGVDKAAKADDLDKGAATDTALADWLASLNLPVPTLPVVAPPAATLDTATASTDAEGGELSGGVAHVLACGHGGAATAGAAALPADLAANTAEAGSQAKPSHDTAVTELPQAAAAAAADAVALAAQSQAQAQGARPLTPLADTLSGPNPASLEGEWAAEALAPTPSQAHSHAPSAHRGLGRDGAELAMTAALAARDNQGGNTNSGHSGDNANRGGNAPVWVPLTAPGNTTSVSAAANPAFAPIGLGGIEAKAEIRAAAAATPAVPMRMTLATPITSPEFPQAMGAQLAVLAQGGVERAELHLNPADMGPVSVQIAIEGTQARIDFGADVAATRQIIENGLPELASALRDAGLTLTGGGVSQHSRSREDMADAQARGNGRGGNGGQAGSPSGETPAAPRRMVRAGGIDMYA